MTLELCSTEVFEEQMTKLDEDSNRIVQSKIELIKTNPFRFKSIHSRKFNRVFRIRFNIKNVETRLICNCWQKNIFDMFA
jgi:mRNA-degrading endonuclease RelE of RelBE toxin-antitoxin system